MHPVAALMLARAMEEEQRRRVRQRPLRSVDPQISEAPERRFSLIQRIRMPRFGLSGS